MEAARNQDIQVAGETYKLVAGVADTSCEKSYSSRARELPSLLQVHGLAQTLVFYMAKGRSSGAAADGYEKAWRHLASGVIAPRLGLDDGFTMKDLCAKMTSDTYTCELDRVLLVECMAFSSWMKRWASALLKSPDGDAGTGGETSDAAGQPQP